MENLHNSMNLQQALDNLCKNGGITPEERVVLDAGSSHSFHCRCEICKNWWVQMGPQNQEEIEENGAEPDYGPFSAKEIHEYKKWHGEK